MTARNVSARIGAKKAADPFSATVYIIKGIAFTRSVKIPVASAMMFANRKTHDIGLASAEDITQASEKCIARKHVRVDEKDPLRIDVVQRVITHRGKAFVSPATYNTAGRLAFFRRLKRQRLRRSVVDHQHFDKWKTAEFCR